MFIPEKTALILVGFQNDYFGDNGLLHRAVEETASMNNIIENTAHLIQHLPKSTLVITTPIRFTNDYCELENPVGILKHIRDVGALQADSFGSQMIAEFSPYAARITEVHGKKGFNAFAHTHLHDLLQSNGIEHVVIAGAITSVCIDSTGRYAHELGYQVSILSDCTAARTIFEQKFYCESIFPVYANVTTHEALLGDFMVAV